MLKYTPTEADILAIENSLVDFEFAALDIEKKIQEAKKILNADFKNNGKQIKMLCTPLDILTDGTKSDEDKIERLRLIVDVTSFTPVATLTLSGTNGDEDETWTEITVITIAATGETTELIDNPFKFYKIEETGTIVVGSAELVEDVHELPWKYKAIALLYSSYQALVGDHWSEKNEVYNQMYFDSFQRTLYSYDQNLDGEVDETELETKTVRFSR